MHRTKEELEAGLELLLASPKNNAAIELIVRRPSVGEREVVESAQLDLELGMLGDNWKARGSAKTEDGLANPGAQLTLMNSRVIQLIAGEKSNWPLAGDQLYLDIDLSAENMPPGTQFQLGSALLEVSSVPHTGCKKFATRFGIPATKFVGSRLGGRNNFRGINAIVLQAGTVSVGDLLHHASDETRGNS